MRVTRRATNGRLPTSRELVRSPTPLIVVATAIGAFLGNHPTGFAAADVVVSAAFVGAVTWAASRARRWAWLTLAIGAVIVAGPALALVAAIAAVLIAAAAVFLNGRTPAVGALVGALAVVAMLSGTSLSATSAAIVCFASIGALAFSAYRESRGARHTVRRVAFVVAVFAASAAALYAVAIAQARPSIDQGLASLDHALAAGRKGNTDTAIRGFDDAARSLRAATASLGAWWATPVRLIPGAGPNVTALDALAHTAATLSGEAAVTAKAADLSSIRVANGRLDLASVGALHDPLARVAAALDASGRRLARVRTSWLIGPVRSRLDTAKDLVGRARPTAALIRDATSTIPRALGAETTRRYLVLFVSPAEARGRTGFIGNFAELEATDGALAMTRFGRTADLQNQGVPLDQRRLTGPDDYLKRYERFGPAYTWQNITMAADFPSVADVARQLYPQSGGREIDGVLSVDPVGLAAFLRFTGPVTLPGLAEPLTAKNAARFLLRDQYVVYANTFARIDALGTLAGTTFARLSQLNVSDPRQFFDRLGAAVSAGHIRFESFDPATRSAAGRGGLRGELRATPGHDFLAITSSNMGGSKIDVFLRREFDYKVELDGERLTGDLSITLHNDAPATGLPAYVVGNVIKPLLPGAKRVESGVNRLFLSVYTPWRVTGLEVDGASVAPDLGTERNLNVASTVVDIPPGGTKTVRLRVAGRAPRRCGYVLDVASQPLPVLDNLRVRVDGGRATLVELSQNHTRVAPPVLPACR